MSVCIASVLLIACYTIWGHVRLPAARLAQVRSARLEEEVGKLWSTALEQQQQKGSEVGRREREGGEGAALGASAGAVIDVYGQVEFGVLTPKQREVVLKGPVCGRHSSHARGWVIGGGILTVLGGWVVFALVIMSGSGARNLGN